MGTIMMTTGAKLFAVATGLFAVILPLIMTGLIPNGFQRWAGAIFCLMGICMLTGLLQLSTSYFSIGMGVGFILGSIKLILGLRFL